MPKPEGFEKTEFNLVAEMDEPLAEAQSEGAFRILLLGDFSGRGNREIFAPAAAISEERLFEVDCDNLDEVMARLAVAVKLPVEGEAHPPLSIQLAELDDLHPGRLWSRLELFKGIREKRKQLSDPVCFARLEAESAAGRSSTPAARAPAEPAGGEGSTSLLNQVLSAAENGRTERPVVRPLSDWDRLLNDIVQPHRLPAAGQRQEAALKLLDEATAELMRAILHYPDFQQLEAAWRALDFLVRRLETGTELKLYLLDVSKSELDAGLNSAGDLSSTAIYRLLVEQGVSTPGGLPWALWAGNYEFDGSRQDAQMLASLAKIAAAADAPFISSASSKLLGCESLDRTPDPRDWQTCADAEAEQAWKALRRLPEASYVGLAIPRLLLRLPYGQATDPIDEFRFEEMEDPPRHEDYLWGNSAFGCVYLLAQAFSQFGWAMRPGMFHEIEDLPLHVYRRQGESKSKPCAEVLLTERAVETILEAGLMLFLSFKNRDAARLARFQSLLDSSAPLAGKWQV